MLPIVFNELGNAVMSDKILLAASQVTGVGVGDVFKAGFGLLYCVWMKKVFFTVCSGMLSVVVLK